MAGPSVLFASERLLPAVGGAELAALELLAALAPGHDVRAAFLSGGGVGFSAAPAGVEAIPVEPPPGGAGPWATQRLRRDALGRAVASALAARPADVVVTQLRAAPPVVDAARAAGAATVLLVPSYESLCKNAFDADSGCRPETGCRGCPRAAELDADERAELLACREAHQRSLAGADRLVAPSRAVADACEQWCGRRPDVVAPVAGMREPLSPCPGGPVLLVASRWIPNKGAALLGPLCAALRDRRVVVTEQGLTPALRARLQDLEHVRLAANAPMGRLLAGAGILLVPSRWPEPFGRVAFEGLAAGVPTLASQVGGLPEFVPADQLVDPPDSVDAWVAAVRRLDSPATWWAARERGIAAARRVARGAPLERLTSLLGATAGARRRAAVIRDEIDRAHTVGLSVPKAGRSWACYFLARYVAEVTGDPLSLDLLDGRVLPPLAFVHEHLDVFEDVSGPANLLNEDLIWSRRAIVLVRDPRDSLVSYWHQKRVREQRPVAERLEDFAESPVHGIERLAEGTGLLLDLHERHPGDCLLATYEDLVADPDGGLTRILRFALAGRELDGRACRAALAASRFERMREWERGLTPEEARARFSGRFGPRHDGATDDAHFKVRQGRPRAFEEEMSPKLRDRVSRLPRTAALLQRLQALR